MNRMIWLLACAFSLSAVAEGIDAQTEPLPLLESVRQGNWDGFKSLLDDPETDLN